MPRKRKNLVARQNFLGLFGSPKVEAAVAAPRMPTEEYNALLDKAHRLSLQFKFEVQALLVHAPDRSGKPTWYYFVGDSTPNARGWSRQTPTAFKSDKPWDEMRRKLNTFRQPDSVKFAVIDAFSGQVEGPITLNSIANRNPRRRRARRNGSALDERMGQLLGLLHTAKSVAWVAHWNAKGPDFYSTHLMFQRIYEELDEPIDELGERYVAYTRSPVKYRTFRGEDVDVPADSLAAATLLDSILGAAQQTSDVVRDIANREISGRSAAGLDDYLMALNNTLDTFRYLLYRYAGK